MNMRMSYWQQFIITVSGPNITLKNKNNSILPTKALFMKETVDSPLYEAEYLHVTILPPIVRVQTRHNYLV